MSKHLQPIIGFCAPSGVGKTTTMEAVVKILVARNYLVAVIKHGHHDPQLDTEGKDTFRLRSAGAGSVVYVGMETWFLQGRLLGKLRWRRWLKLLRPFFKGYDVIMIEGFKMRAHPKIFLHRRGVNDLSDVSNYRHVIAIASDAVSCYKGYRVVGLNEYERIAALIIDRVVKVGMTRG